MKNGLLPMIGFKRAYIFDLFDTLISVGSRDGENGPPTWEILGVSRDAWSHQVFNNSRDRLTGKVHNPIAIMERLARAIDPSISEELIERAARRRIVKFRDAILHPDPDILSILARLREGGKRIGLLSNADSVEVSGWEQSPLSRMFDSVVFSCRAGCMKPEREIYELALRELDADSGDAAFIGDGSCNELSGAKEAGIFAIFVTRFAAHLSEELHEERVNASDATIGSLDELLY